MVPRALWEHKEEADRVGGVLVKRVWVWLGGEPPEEAPGGVFDGDED